MNYRDQVRWREADIPTPPNALPDPTTEKQLAEGNGLRLWQGYG
jgi:hypothetical protein